MIGRLGTLGGRGVTHMRGGRSGEFMAARAGGGGWREGRAVRGRGSGGRVGRVGKGVSPPEACTRAAALAPTGPPPSKRYFIACLRGWHIASACMSIVVICMHELPFARLAYPYVEYNIPRDPFPYHPRPDPYPTPLPSPAESHAVAILQSRVNVLCSSTLVSRENERHHFCQFF